jgi:hypothetical protein
MRFLSPTASPRSGQRLCWPGLPHPTACASRFSQPLDAFIRPEPGGLVSCRIRSWGCALQSFPPPVQPYAVSGALPLLTFKRARPPLHQPRTRPPKRPTTKPAYGTAPGTPPPSGVCSTRESATRHRRLNRRRARSSPGLSALQGAFPHWNGATFAVPPLMGLARPDANGRLGCPPGSQFQRDWLVSLETADPPGLWRLLTITNVRVGRGSGVASSSSGVRRRPLSSHL